MKQEIIEQIKSEKIIAIIRGVYGDDCVKLAKLLVENGIHIMEVPFDISKQDNSCTIDAIKRIKNEVPNVIVGAGTVVSVDLVNKAKDAGARIIVSPDSNEDVIRETIKYGLVSMPGAVTPTEIMFAKRCGADFVKLFPAYNLGPSYIKAVMAPINNVPLLAVGGVNEKNAFEFIKAGAVGVGVGCVANKKLIQDNDWETIEKIIKELKLNVESNCI